MVKATQIVIGITVALLVLSVLGVIIIETISNFEAILLFLQKPIPITTAQVGLIALLILISLFGLRWFYWIFRKGVRILRLG